MLVVTDISLSQLQGSVSKLPHTVTNNTSDIDKPTFSSLVENWCSVLVVVIVIIGVYRLTTHYRRMTSLYYIIQWQYNIPNNIVLVHII